MNESVRDLLHQGADTVERPQLDIGHLVGQAERRLFRRRFATVATSAVAVTMIVTGGLVLRPDEQRPAPAPPVPTETPKTPEPDETIPLGPSDVLAVRQVGKFGLEVAGTTVPGRWGVNGSRGDVWVAIKTGDDEYESQWWGKGTTAHKMPPSVGSILRGGVVISQDAHWIVWTRPASDVYGKNPPRVMEVVDTATGQVRWSRNADADAVEIGALAVTNDGVVVFAHCLEPVLDRGGWPQCDDARVDVWAPEVGVTGTLPAKVSVGDSPFPDTVTTLAPLAQRTGAHNGLLIQSATSARPQYVRVSERGDIEVVATLPRDTVAVTADERFALLAAECPDGLRGCGWSVLPLHGGERRAIPSLADLLDPRIAPYYAFVVERDDLLLVQQPGERGGGRAVARCSLARASCVPIRE